MHEQLLGCAVRKIIHVDADCFYTAVELLARPELQGKPVAVGGSPERRGVIATANYPAREYGVRSAMATKEALKRCPELVLLAANMPRYRQVSAQMHEVFQEYTDLIEPISLDEAFLDVTGCEQCQGSASLIAAEIRQKIACRIGITVSAGIANNKFLAKVASDWRKPNGQTTIAPDQVAAFVKTLPVAKIPGVGPVMQQKLAALHVYSAEDMQQLSLAQLLQHCGSFGERLYQLCRGIDLRDVKPSRERKSISVEQTFERDLQGLPQLMPEISKLYQDLQARIERVGGANISGGFVKVKFSDFTQTTLSRSQATINLSSYIQWVEQAAARDNKSIRLLGMGVQLSGESRQLSLF